MKQVRVRVDRYFGLLFPEVFWKKKAVLPQNNYHQKMYTIVGNVSSK